MISQRSWTSDLLNPLQYGTKLFLDWVIYVSCYLQLQDTNDQSSSELGSDDNENWRCIVSVDGGLVANICLLNIRPASGYLK